MKTAFFVCFSLAAALASADDSGVYSVHNGRGEGVPTSKHPAASAPRGGIGGSSPATKVTAVPAAAHKALRGRSGGTAGAGRGIYRSRSAPRARRADAPAPTGGGTDNPPPYYSKPGALIRTAGQLPVYSDPGPAGTNPGPTNVIGLQADKAHDTAGVGVTRGAPDTPPKPNATPGVGAGGSGATSNGGTRFDPSF